MNVLVICSFDYMHYFIHPEISLLITIYLGLFYFKAVIGFLYYYLIIFLKFVSFLILAPIVALFKSCREFKFCFNYLNTIYNENGDEL